MNRSARAAYTVLDRIVEAKRAEVGALRRDGTALRRAAEERDDPARPFAAALRVDGVVALLAEVKRQSPSAGEIRPNVQPADIAAGYEAGGAAAVSVLTDREFFGGTLADLEAVRSRIGLPVLRKDFTLDAVQLWQARAAGADAVLLIARILDDAELTDLLALSTDLGMSTLVEIHEERELERALKAGAQLVGINNRDLARFTTDLEITLRLAAEVPRDATLVSESGIRTAADVERLGAAGVDAILVGEALMREEDVTAAARTLVGIGKAAR